MILFVHKSYLNIDEVFDAKKAFIRAKREAILGSPDAGGTGGQIHSDLRRNERNGPVHLGQNPDNIVVSTQVTEGNEMNRVELGETGSIISVEFKKKPLTQRLCILLRNAAYISTLLGICSLFFMLSGIVYWLSHYFTNVLGIS